jgi:hypothetical protein
MTRRRKRLIWIVASAIAVSAVAAFLLRVLAPLFRSTDDFLVLASDVRIRYQPGAEAAASVVAQALPAAIATIERAQFRPFVRPVQILVCATTTRFDRHGYGVRGAGGFVLNGRLFLSPKPQNTPERLPRLLTHELSHLHLEQQIGMLRGSRQLPGWFKEGLAVHVSNGAGAENVTAAEAKQAIVRGRTFRLDTKGSWLFPQTAARDGLEPHLFYRESALFVSFLARSDPAAFQRLLIALQDRQPFGATVKRTYQQDLAALWTQFAASLKSAD